MLEKNGNVGLWKYLEPSVRESSVKLKSRIENQKQKIVPNHEESDLWLFFIKYLEENCFYVKTADFLARQPFGGDNK